MSLADFEVVKRLGKFHTLSLILPIFHSSNLISVQVREHTVLSIK